MNTRKLQLSRIVLALGAVVLVGGLAAPVRAQDAGTTATTEPSKSISLNLVNVPVQAALRTLFSSAGIRNYSIKSDVQGFANINVSEVPFTLALRQLLGSVNPPLTYTVTDGTYIVSVQQATPPPPFVSTAPPSFEGSTSYATDPTSQPKRFYVVPINHYDAYIIAQLLEKTSGIIQVPVNVVIPSSGGNGSSNGSNPGGGFGGSLSAPVTTLGNGNNGSFNGNRFGGNTGGFNTGSTSSGVGFLGGPMRL